MKKGSPANPHENTTLGFVSVALVHLCPLSQYKTSTNAQMVMVQDNQREKTQERTAVEQQSEHKNNQSKTLSGLTFKMRKYELSFSSTSPVTLKMGDGLVCFIA